MRWAWRGIALGAVLLGWLAILLYSHRHITAPTVFLCLGHLAAVATIYNLWRTGASTVASSDEEDDSTWAKPAGALGGLEREKRTLLKAIKEAEFDHQMGKLSQRDADDMIRTYRARAIEVIKEIARLTLGSAGSAREQILREVRARLELEARSRKKPAAAASDGNASARKDGKKAKTDDAPGAGAAMDAGDTGAKLEAPAVSDEGDADDAPGEAAAEAAALAARDGAAARAAVQEHDESLDADSTTTVESRRDVPAKEASQ